MQPPETPKLYTRVKIHKTVEPGRRVINFVSCHTNTVSKYVDFLTIRQKYSFTCKRHYRFPSKIRYGKTIPNDCLLITLDVRSLYKNLPNIEGIKAVRKTYDNHPSKTVATKVIITFLGLILTFVFNSINFLQIMGCAIDTICVPSYENVFMT